MKKILYISVLIQFCISFLFSNHDHHNHSHEHNNEFSLSLGLVPSHEDENANIGMHIHYVKGFGNHNEWGYGLSVEKVFDIHEHNSLSLIGIYRFHNGFSIAYAPGVLLAEHEHDGEIEKEYEFTQHMEFVYEIELEKFHIGPQFDIGLEESGVHFMFGVHFGVDF
jgi:hypothetical protein